MATQHNFRVKNGLEVAGVQRISAAGVITGTLDSNTTATTQSASDNSTKIATTAYTDAAITAVIGGAPGTLDTLNELAAAINDDASYASTLTTALAGKLPLAGGTMSGALNMGANQITNSAKITATELTITGGSDGADLYINNTSPTLGFTDSNSFSDSSDIYIVRAGSTGDLQFQFFDDSANTNTTTFQIDETGNTTIAGNVSVGGSAYTTSADLNLLGDGLAIKNDKNGSNNNWSLIQNTGTSSAANLAFTTGLGVALTLNHDKSATFAGTISSGAITSSGIVKGTNFEFSSTAGKIHYGGSGDTGDYVQIQDVSSGSNVFQVVQDSGVKFGIDGVTGNVKLGGNLTHASDLAIDVAGAITLDAGTGGTGILLKDDGAQYGNLKGNSGAPTRLVIDSSSVAGYLSVAGTEYFAWNTTDIRPTANNAYNLGINGARFKDIYISGGIDFGQASSVNSASRNNNYLDDYEEGTWTPVISHNDGSGVIPYTLQAASYVKIGSVVYVRAYMTAINPNGNAGTSSPYYGIRGFPFQPVGYGSWMLVYASSNIDSYGGYTAPASFYLLEPTGSSPHGQGHVSGTEFNGWGSNLTWMFSVVYNTS